jgi:glycogen phosphorylase
MLADSASRGKALAHWKQTIIGAWTDVKVLDLDIDTSAAHEGDQRDVHARVELGGLDASEVTVQALHGPIDSTGAFIGTPAAIILQPTGGGGFAGTYPVGEAGPYGVTVRAVPRHDDLISPMEMGLVAWAD